MIDLKLRRRRREGVVILIIIIIIIMQKHTQKERSTITSCVVGFN
jgi:uncharacterized membrane protein YobD (UPF0266 family)